MRRFLFFAFLAVLFFSHFFTLLTKLSIGHISTQITSSIPLILLAGISYMLCIGFLISKRATMRGANTLDVLIIAYLAVIFIQVFNPHLPHLIMGLRGLYESGLWILAYLIARVLVTKENYASKLVFVIALTSVLGAFYGLFTLYIGVGTIERAYVEYAAREDLLLRYRSIGTLGSPFGFGLMCAIGFVAAINIKLRNKLRLKKFATVSLTFFLLVGVLIAGSRSVMLGILASLVGLLALALFRKLNRETTSLASRKNVTKYVSFLLLASVTSYMFLSAYFPYQRERVVSILNLRNEVNVSARIDIWRELLPYFESNPMGYGTGSLGSAAYRYGPIIGGVKVADNQYLDIVMEYGIIGVILILTIFSVILVSYLRVCKLDRSGVSLAALLASVIILVAGIGAPSLKAYPGNLFFGVLLGAFSSTYSRLMLGKTGRSFTGNLETYSRDA
jgi:O-antigen ligase